MNKITNNDSSMFFHSFMNVALNEIKKEYSYDANIVDLTKKISNKTKKIFLEKSASSDKISNILNKIDSKNANETERKIKKQISIDTNKIIEELETNDVEIKEYLKNIFSDDKIIHDALIKTVSTKRFVGLKPELKEFMLMYDNAVLNSKYYHQFFKKISREGQNIWNNKIFELNNSISIDIQNRWNNMTIAEKRLLKKEYGITDQSIENLAMPIQNKMMATLSSLEEKVQKQITELQDLPKKNRAEKKSDLEQDLQSLVIFMKSPKAKLYRKDREKFIYRLVEEAKKLGVKVDITGN